MIFREGGGIELFFSEFGEGYLFVEGHAAVTLTRRARSQGRSTRCGSGFGGRGRLHLRCERLSLFVLSFFIHIGAGGAG